MAAPVTRVLYLASRSPRRLALLRQVGVEPVVLDADVNEEPGAGEPAGAYAARVARDKALAGAAACTARGLRAGPVLGADTCLELDSEILGKPRDGVHGRQMLARLAGRSHTVYTAVCLVDGGRQQEAMSASTVTFGPLDEAEIARYWASGEPADKAGAYAVQGRAAAFVARLEGSYSGVVGLPLFEVCTMLRSAGFEVP